MKKEVLLTNEDYVRGVTLIDNNLQSKFILSAIREAQEVGLQEITGSILLNKLKDMVADGSIADSGNTSYKELIEESQLYLAYKTVSNLCLIINVKISNGGLQQTSDENLTVLNINDTFVLQKHYEDKSDFFAKRLQKYLLQNYDKYPELSEAKCNEMRANLYSAASSSLWLGGKRGKGRYIFPPYIGK